MKFCSKCHKWYGVIRFRLCPLVANPKIPPTSI